MSFQRFEWDPVKARINERKHGISFETAVRAFADEDAVVEQDRFVDGEERWLLIGRVQGSLLLLVAHMVREDDQSNPPIEIVRIISAREAGRQEKRRYERQYGSIRN